MEDYIESMIDENNIIWDAKEGVTLPIRKFLEKYKHENWSLYIYDTITEQNTHINCLYNNIIDVISYVYNIEHAEPISFIAEDRVARAYVVGMPLTKGKVNLKAINMYRES